MIVMDFKLKLLQEDKRGSVHLFKFDGKEHLLIYTKAGYYRGGEIHLGRQTNMMIYGEVDWCMGGKLSRTISPVTVTIPAHTPHMMYSISDSLMIEFREFPLEKPVVYYEPYRKIVKKNMDGRV